VTYLYERDPAAIYRQSFAAIRYETDLSDLPADLVDVAIRLVHACGLPELVGELAWTEGAAAAGRKKSGRRMRRRYPAP